MKRLQPPRQKCPQCNYWDYPAKLAEHQQDKHAPTPDLPVHARRKPRRKATPEEQAAARAVRIAREEESRTKAERQRERDRQRFAEYQAETPTERARRQHAKRRPTEETHEYPG